MRWLVFLPLFGCAVASHEDPGDVYETMRDRLAGENTRFLISGQSTGDVLARRWVHDHWEESRVPLVIESGDLVVHSQSNSVRVDKLAVHFAPFDIPEAVFEQPAALADAKFMQTTAAQINPTWGGPNLATASLPLNIEISWHVDVDVGRQPFHVPLVAVPVDLKLEGSGGHIDAKLGIRVHGVVWSLAGMYELADATLALDAASVD